MLLYACIFAVPLLAIALRLLAEGDDPDNGVYHEQEDEEPDQDPDLIAAAA